MKKVFLFLTASLFGVAAMAGNIMTITEDDETGTTEIQIGYNSYGGDKDEDGVPDQWQASTGYTNVKGDATDWALKDVVADLTGNENWLPEIGEAFMVNIAGTANMTGKMQMFLVDEREEALYWSQAAPASSEIDMKAGEPFDVSGVMIIDNNKYQTKDGVITDVEIETKDGQKGIQPALVFGFFPTETSSITTLKEAEYKAQILTLTLSTFEIIYQKAGDYEDPINLAYGGKADVEADGYKYQSANASKVASVKEGDYVNVKVSFTPTENISTLMYCLVDVSEAASKGWMKTTDDMISFASNLVKDQAYSFEFSKKLDLSEGVGENPIFQDIFMAQSQDKTIQVVLNKSSLEVSVGEKKYAEPVLDAVEEIAAEEAIVNGVIYAESIVIYNAAGQVVANASESFAIAALPAGVYFANTSNGAFTFSK